MTRWDTGTYDTLRRLNDSGIVPLNEFSYRLSSLHRKQKRHGTHGVRCPRKTNQKRVRAHHVRQPAEVVQRRRNGATQQVC